LSEIFDKTMIFHKRVLFIVVVDNTNLTSNYNGQGGSMLGGSMLVQCRGSILEG